VRAALVALALALAGACTRPAPEPRNLLLVSLDAVRAEHLEHPERFFEVPLFLSAFRDEAVRFTRCISASPGTLPAAAAIHTGRHPRDVGRPGMTRALAEDAPTLAEVLKRAGFATAAVVGPFSLRPSTGIARGFDHYSAPRAPRLEDYGVAEQARAWLREHADGEAPWFLWVHLNAAHGPYWANFNAFNSMEYLRRLVVPGSLGDERPIRMGRDNTGRGALPRYQNEMEEPKTSEYQRYYNTRVRQGEWFAQELRLMLKVLDRYDETVVVVVGTHGEANGEHGVWFHHGEDLHHESLHVPLWLGVPGREPAVVERTVGHADLMPTLLSVFGLDVPAGVRGRDLLAPATPTTAFALSELYPPLGPADLLALTADRLKLVRDGSGEVRVYDHAADPAETAPRPLDAVPEARELARVLEGFAGSPVAPARELALRNRAAQLAKLQALGYVAERFEEP